MPSDDHSVEQLYFEDLEIGDTYDYPSQTISETHFQLFAAITGDFHAMHLDKHYVQENTDFDERVSHGMLNTAFTVLGASSLSPHLHESAVAFLSQSSRFLNAVVIGDSLYPEIEVSEKELTSSGETGIVTFETKIFNQDDEQVLEGELEYMIKVRDAGE